MKRQALNRSGVLSFLTLFASMVFFGIIFQDWEGFKAGWYGTCEPPAIINYRDIILKSLVISLPLAMLNNAKNKENK